MLFDSNLWYNLQAVAVQSMRSAQWCSQEIVCNSDVNITGTNASWQFIALDPSDTSKFTLRNLGIGPDSALASFLDGNETQPGFAPLELHDATQQWNFTSIEAANVTAYSIGNVANGTNYAMAERGNHMFMAAYAPNASFLSDASGAAQQWVITQAGEINDPAWSATHSASATSTATQHPTEDQHKHHVGGGAIAGIAVGAILIGLVILGVAIACFVYFRRSVLAKRAEQQARRSTDSDTTIVAAEKMSEERAELDGKAEILDPVEMPTENAERHELPV